MTIGFFTFALNNGSTNFVKLAYLQALAVKSTQKYADFAVAVREDQKIPKKYESVFDHIIRVPANLADNPVLAETYLTAMSPFMETFKLEADCIPTKDMSHMLRALRSMDLVFGHNCLRYDGKEIIDVANRPGFVDYRLPNIYTGICYSRRTMDNSHKMLACRDVVMGWDFIREKFPLMSEKPTTDEVFAVTSYLTDTPMSIPGFTGMQFVHLKPSVQGIETDKVSRSVNIEISPRAVKINNILQLNPVHYYEKDLCTDEIIKDYESNYRRIIKSFKRNTDCFVTVADE